jgi:hypothetical protein
VLVPPDVYVIASVRRRRQARNAASRAVTSRCGTTNPRAAARDIAGRVAAFDDRHGRPAASRLPTADLATVDRAFHVAPKARCPRNSCASATNARCCDGSARCKTGVPAGFFRAHADTSFLGIVVCIAALPAKYLNHNWIHPNKGGLAENFQVTCSAVAAVEMIICSSYNKADGGCAEL